MPPVTKPDELAADNPLAGIHGVPFVPWNGVQASPGANQSGYCPHSSVLFPTWHRPYLALYEVGTARSSGLALHDWHL